MHSDATTESLSQPPGLAFKVHAGSGPYLLLVHGILSSAAQWLQNLPALQAVCRPVTVELWGHGASPTPDDPALYQPQAYVQQFEAIRTQLGCQRWLVCGYSLGAGLTVRYTLTYPERVIAHVFTNSASGFAASDQVRRWQAEAPALAQRIEAQGLSAIEKIPVHPRYARRLPEDVKAALLADAANLSPAGVAAALTTTNPQASVRQAVVDNPRPALLCFGRHEQKFTPTRDWLIDHVPNLQEVQLNAGHAVNMEDAAGFNAAVAAFIQGHTA